MNALLLAFLFPLFLGALLSDAAYHQTGHVQWHNFASWLLAGALVFSGFALLWALVAMLRWRAESGRQRLFHFVVLLAAWAVGLVNALVHAKDAWAIMPEALVLSVLGTLLALVATWIGFAGFDVEGRTSRAERSHAAGQAYAGERA